MQTNDQLLSSSNAVFVAQDTQTDSLSETIVQALVETYGLDSKEDYIDFVSLGVNPEVDDDYQVAFTEFLGNN